MDSEQESDEPPAAFLAALGKRLSERGDVDVDLADILRAHLLKVSPVQDAVAQAKAAISKLAEGRASPPKTEKPNG
jgi:hypothetical protein